MAARTFLEELPDEKSEARLSARVPARVKEMIKMAAELSGATRNSIYGPGRLSRSSAGD